MNEQTKEMLNLQLMFLVVEKTGARLEKSEDRWYYLTNSIDDNNCIVGFGSTPMEALIRFYCAFGGEI